MRATLSLDFSLSLRQDLHRSVDPLLDIYWSEQVLRGGIIPQEILGNEMEMQKFPQELEVFGRFVGQVAEQAFGTTQSPHKRPYIVHVVGVGTGHDLRQITIAANNRRMPVWAYDTCRVAHSNAVSIFQEIGERIRAYPRDNRAYLADIERVCQDDVLNPDSAKFLFLVRVLETLNRPSKEPKKMERVCAQIGRLLSYLKVVVVGARPLDNIGVHFNNTEPTPIEAITGPMEWELGRPIRVTSVGEKFQHFDHKYSATLIEKAG